MCLSFNWHQTLFSLRGTDVTDLPVKVNIREKNFLKAFVPLCRFSNFLYLCRTMGNTSCKDSCGSCTPCAIDPEINPQKNLFLCFKCWLSCSQVTDSRCYNSFSSSFAGWPRASWLMVLSFCKVCTVIVGNLS